MRSPIGTTRHTPADAAASDTDAPDVDPGTVAHSPSTEVTPTPISTGALRQATPTATPGESDGTPPVSTMAAAFTKRVSGLRECGEGAESAAGAPSAAAVVVTFAEPTSGAADVVTFAVLACTGAAARAIRAIRDRAGTAATAARPCDAEGPCDAGRPWDAERPRDGAIERLTVSATASATVAHESPSKVRSERASPLVT
jgi:hypothetical protein